MLPWACLALGAVALIPSSHAATSSPYRIALTSTSAELDFWPSADGNATFTWNATWTGTPWSRYIRETAPEGMGFHYHTKTRPGNISNPEGEDVWVGYTFVGSRIEYWGYWAYPGRFGQASVNLTDGEGNVIKGSSGASGAETNSKDPTILVAHDFAEVGNHSTRLVPNAGTIALTHVVATLNISGTPEEVNQAADNPTDIWFSDLVDFDSDTTVTGAKPDAPMSVDLAYGNWKQTPTIGAQGNGPVVTYPRIGTTDTNAQMRFNIGTGNIYVRINGTMAWNHGVFQVNVDPAPPGRDSQQKYWGYTPWSVVNATYYHTALDPSQNYTFTLTNLNSEGSDAKSVWLEPATLTLWKKPGKGKGNIGAIAGGVVGGVLGAAIIGGLIWFFLRRRNKNSKDATLCSRTSSLIDGDPEDIPALTPFMSQHQPLPSVSSGSPPSKLAPVESGSSTSDYFGKSGYPSGSAQPQPIAVDSLPPSTAHRPLQAADAGTLHPTISRNSDPEEDMIPPSYDPVWERSSAASLARAGSLAPPQMPEGAHQRNSIPREEPNEAELIKAMVLSRRL